MAPKRPPMTMPDDVGFDDMDDMDDDGEEMPEAAGSGVDLVRDFFTKGKAGDYEGAWSALSAAVALASDEE